MTSDASAFRTTLRQMSEADDARERMRLHDLLASQLEVAFNQIGNHTQVVLWDVQEKSYQKIDALHEQVGNNNTLLSAVIEALNGLRGDVKSSAVESAATLGKFATELEALRHGQEQSAALYRNLSQRMDDSEDDRAQLRQRLERIEQILAERPGQREAEHQALLAAIRGEHADNGL